MLDFVSSLQSAMGFEYKGEVQQHTSQKGQSTLLHLLMHHLLNCFRGSALLVLDYAKGFGGKYGVEKEKVDKAALGYDYKGETEKHQSQKGEFTSDPSAVLLRINRQISHILYLYQITQRGLEGSMA